MHAPLRYIIHFVKLNTQKKKKKTVYDVISGVVAHLLELDRLHGAHVTVGATADVEEVIRESL